VDGSNPVKSLLNPLQVISTLNMVMRGIQMLSHRIGEESGRLADVYIAPDTGHAQWFEFHKLESLVAAGREAAQAALERIHEVCPRDE
jgi:predicted acylesterase/phospholipase RssA